MHALIAPTKILRTNLTKIGAVIVPAEPAFRVRRVRLTIPNGLIVGLSLEEEVADIAYGIRTYTWAEVEGPQTNFVFYLTGAQQLSAVLSEQSPAGLAPRCSVIIEYPESSHPE